MAAETDTAQLKFEDDFSEGAKESIAAADALAAALVGVEEASERIKDLKFIQADKLKVISSEMQQQAALAARIASLRSCAH
jgi:hypothetical protein